MAHYPAACTIASNNYLAYAKVWAESFRAHHPELRLFACVVDEPSSAVDYASLPWTTVFARDLAIPNFLNLAFRYGVVELNTAVKPFFLAHLRDVERVERVLYFDPDIWVASRLVGLERALERGAIVLTPHITGPLDDAGRPDERELRLAGIYNLGFLGLSLDERTAGFLEWWQRRLLRFCVSDPRQGLFVDQSWMDFAPAFLDQVDVCRDPELNVAYWNLSQRRLQLGDDGWEVAGRPLGFFHFSGLDLENLTSVSRHQDRLRLTDRLELVPLFASYRDRVLAAGHATYRELPYGYGKFRDVDCAIPQVARELLQQVDPLACRFGDPFATRSPDSYVSYLCEPLRFARGTLNRLLLAYWERRPDLVRSFPEVCGADLPAYVEWLTIHGEARLAGIPESFLEGIEIAIGHPCSAGRSPREAVDRDPLAFDDALGAVDLAAPREMASWLNEPVAGSPRLTRLALAIHRRRLDLQLAYPDPLEEHRLGYAYWFCVHGAREYRLHASLVEGVARSLPWRPRLGAAVAGWRASATRRGVMRTPQASVPAEEEGERGRSVAGPARQLGSRPALGVNVGGYFSMDTGVGQVVRGTLEALQHVGIPHADIELSASLSSDVDCLPLLAGAPHSITLLHANADQIGRVVRLLPKPVASGMMVGYWFWELAFFPLELAGAFSHLHEVWSPSQFCADALAPLSTVPVRLVRPCVIPPAAAPGRDRWGMLPERFYFLFCFDMRSVVERKNPFGLIEAFRLCLAEPSPRPLGLILKLNGAEERPEVVAELRQAAGDLPVTILPESLGRLAIESLLASADAFVSLHRSEGLGLPAIESLYLGKPVIASAYGGITDFLDEQTGFPVACRTVALERSYGPYPRGATWGEPDLRAAAEAMRRVVRQPDQAAQRAANGRRRVTSMYGLEAAGARLRGEVERLLLRCVEGGVGAG